MTKDILIAILIIIIINKLRKFFKRRKKEKENYGERDGKALYMPATDKENEVGIERKFTGKETVNAKVAAKTDLLESIDLFSRRRSFWDHPIEEEIFRALRQFISDEYIIIPHDSFNNIFYWKWDKDWKLTDRVSKMHFDFVIYDHDFHPIFLMEVNGKEHEKPNRVEIDNFKALLLEKVELKLIAIDASKTIVNPKKEVEERIRQEYPDRKSCPVYCPACHSHIPMMLQRNGESKKYFYRCANKECGETHSIGNSGGYKIIAPLYKNMPEKISI